MTAIILLLAGVLGLAFAAYLWPKPTESEIQEVAGSIDYVPELVASMKRGRV